MGKERSRFMSDYSCESIVAAFALDAHINSTTPLYYLAETLCQTPNLAHGAPSGGFLFLRHARDTLAIFIYMLIKPPRASNKRLKKAV